LGTATGLFRIVSAVAWAHYFGREHLGSISGTATTISVFGAAMGPLPFGVARDLLGSYHGALSILSLLPLALGITSLLMSPPHKTE
jgi:cyanate permease